MTNPYSDLPEWIGSVPTIMRVHPSRVEDARRQRHVPWLLLSGMLKIQSDSHLVRDKVLYQRANVIAGRELPERYFQHHWEKLRASC